MKLAIMQPYLFPYIGYFQLINAVDTFVIYDDVNYIKGGWINRNFILGQGRKQLITLEVEGASQNRLINEISVGSNAAKLLKTILYNYSKAPQFDAVFPLINNILHKKEKILSLYIEQSLRMICEYLNINVEWIVSSKINKSNDLCGQDKILAICKELGATEYMNLYGGRELYDHEIFGLDNIRLSFIKPASITYSQNKQNFVNDLSIIDVMMFNNQSRISSLLQEYQIVK